MLRFSKDGLERAEQYLQESMQLVSDNVLLMSAMGQLCWQYVNAGLSTDTGYLKRAEGYARNILTKDPQSVHGHRLAGLVLVHRADVQGAVQRLKRAVLLDATDVDTMTWLCLSYTLVGRCEAAAPLARRVVELDPLTPLYQVLPATVDIAAGRFAEALRRV